MRLPLLVMPIALVVAMPGRASYYDYVTREVNMKLVYAGPGVGKAESLAFIHLKTSTNDAPAFPPKSEDPVLTFSFLPLMQKSINGFRLRIHLYTRVEPSFMEETRKRLLQGADGIVFVASANPADVQANAQAYAEMKKHLTELALTPVVVVQVEGTTKPGALTIEQVKASLGLKDEPTIATDAATGAGVFDALKAVSKPIVTRISQQPVP